jgi:hypothetical protein
LTIHLSTCRFTLICVTFAGSKGRWAFMLTTPILER